jgi:hypothetical protein
MKQVIEFQTRAVLPGEDAEIPKRAGREGGKTIPTDEREVDESTDRQGAKRRTQLGPEWDVHDELADGDVDESQVKGVGENQCAGGPAAAIERREDKTADNGSCSRSDHAAEQAGLFVVRDKDVPMVTAQHGDGEHPDKDGKRARADAKGSAI